MKWYKITATMFTDVYAFVEAEDEKEALEYARGGEPDAGHYVEETQGGGWRIDDALEVTEPKEQWELRKWKKTYLSRSL